MNKRYADYITGQEEPELLPNEIAYHLSQLLGYEHFLIHTLLVQVNPVVLVANEQWYLSDDELPAIHAALALIFRSKLPDALLAPLTPLVPCPTTSTTTA